MSLFDLDSMQFFTKERQSLDLSQFAEYLYDRRVSSVSLCDARYNLTHEIDMSLETEEEIVRYGTHVDADIDQFASELFGSIYEDSPNIKDNEWSAVHNMLNDLPEMQQLKSVVSNDADMSAVATAHVLDCFSEQIKDCLKEYRAWQEKQDEKEQDNGDPGGTPGNPGGNDQPEQFAPSKDLKQGLSAKSKQLEQSMKDLKEAKDALSMIPGDDDGNDQGDGSRLEFAKELKNNEKLKYIIGLVGRLRNLMNSLPARSFNEESRQQIVTMGRAPFNDLLTSEQNLLASDYTTDVFVDRYIKRKQLRWVKKGESKSSFGPIMVLVDESGSMGGERENMAAAFTTAIALNAMEEDRDFYRCGFTRCISNEASFVKGQSEWDGSDCSNVELVRMLAVPRSAGGTNFNPVLEHTYDFIKNKEDKADVIFLTDGAGRLSSQTVEAIEKLKKEKHCRIFTIIVGGGELANVELISDYIIPMASLAESESIESLARILRASSERR